MRPKAIYLILLSILCLNCSSQDASTLPEHIEKLDNLTVHSPDTEPTREISLEEEVIYKDTEEVTRGRILGNVVVDSRGRVYIPDFQAKVVHVYNADGSYLNSIGRQGRGPGEFQMIWTLRVANDRMHVLDYIHQKISVFDLETQRHLWDLPLSLNQDAVQAPPWLEETRRNNLFYKPINFYVRPDGQYLIFFGDEDVRSADNVRGRTYEVSVYDPAEKKYLEHDLFSFDWTGQMLVHKERDRISILNDVPYKRSSRFSYSGSELIHGWTDEILLKKYDEDGGYQRTFYYPHSKIPLEVDDVLAWYQDISERAERAIRNDTLPETWPAFNAMKLDDGGRLWISTFTSDPHAYDWWVLDAADGTLLARFDWPRKKEVEQVKNGKLYTRETEKETGLEEIVRYDIIMN